MGVKLRVTPITLRVANAFITQHHRHHGTVVGMKFAIGVVDTDGVLHGVATVGRPVARGYDKGAIAEVNRLATDGTPNACSMLYGASARIARDMGYDKIVTYILDSEPGISLKASGWVFDHGTQGGSWNGAGRMREDKHPMVNKQCWVKSFGESNG
jgi:hypothetical protein